MGIEAGFILTETAGRPGDKCQAARGGKNPRTAVPTLKTLKRLKKMSKETTAAA